MRSLEGLEVTNRIHAAVAETDDEFATRIAELLQNAPARRAVATGAPEWACRHLDEEKWVRQYDALYDSVLRH